MTNLFDSENYPTVEPDTLTVGERWAWKRPDISSSYAPALYTLEYRLALQDATPSFVTLQATDVDDTHVVEIGSAVTTAYTAGEYSWQAVIIRDSDSEELVVGRGNMELLADFGSQTGDSRSWVFITLQSIRAVIARSATTDQASMSIAGRSLSRRSLAELVDMEQEFSQRWKNERAKTDRENGRKAKQNRVYLKMGA